MDSHPEKEIQHAIDRLRAEIEALDSDSAEAKTLTEVVAELELAITELGEEDAPITERVNGLIEKFEIEHPRITAIVNDLMVTLSGIGI